jgi:cell division septation protein DedD
MKNLKHSPHSYERHTPPPMPFVVYASQRTRISFWQRFSYALRHRPVVVLLTLLLLLSLGGWGLISLLPAITSLPAIASYLNPEPSKGADAVVVQPSPVPSAKLAVSVPTAPAATPAVTPQPTPQASLPPSQPVKSAPPVVAEAGRFTLQIIASQQLAEAEAQVAKMKGLGLQAKSVTVTLPQKGVWHRVHVGRFATREAATRAGQQLQAQKSITAFLVTAYQE